MIINTLEEFKAWILVGGRPKNPKISPEVIQLVRPCIPYNDEAMDKIRRAGTIEAFLQYIVNKGYLLHGSSEPPIYSVLIPFDPNHTEDEYRFPKAVYATDIPALALWYATLDIPAACKLNKRSGYKILYPGQIIIATDSVVNVRHDGFIYVLPKNEFKKVRGYEDEFYSASPVMSKLIIPVKVSDFTQHIYSGATWEELEMMVDKFKAKKRV